MNALPLPQPPESPKPRRSRQSARRARPQPVQSASRHRILAAEAIAKLGVNAVISSAAIAALVQLIPQSISQQTKLKEIQAEVQIAETRVTRLKADFNRYFDPQQATAIVQEQTNRADPNQRLIVLDGAESPKQAAPAQNP
ncbi:hypothetical protein NC981_11170 [Leptolyngbya sp. DQ-M1]|uniref:slr1601 family putative cell division protein n=1 Tax=Leptolyngbya sp. DQ-M1 TaxID=2933920 RepID=UPI0032998781